MRVLIASLLVLLSVASWADCPPGDLPTPCWVTGSVARICWDPLVNSDGKPTEVNQFEVVLLADTGGFSSFTVPGSELEATFKPPAREFTAQLFAHLKSGKTIKADPSAPILVYDPCPFGDFDCDLDVDKADLDLWLADRRCRVPDSGSP